MQTARSAVRTCIESRPPPNRPLLFLIPISLHAREMRTAISPRFAMRTHPIPRWLAIYESP